MRIAVIQLDVDLGEPLPDRVARAADLVRARAGTDLVVLPELWPQGGFAYETWADTAEPADGPTVQAFSAAARAIGGYVHMGSFVERSAAGLHNTSVLLGPDGSVLATYRKIHLFGFGGGEPERLVAGEEVVTCPSPYGTLGLATCYDLRFPEQFRALLDAGAQILLLVSAWPTVRASHWRVLTQARAIENQMLVVACNTAGAHAGTAMAGGSLVVDPWGAILAEAGPGEEVLDVTVDQVVVDHAREVFPVLRDRRLGVVRA